MRTQIIQIILSHVSTVQTMNDYLKTNTALQMRVAVQSLGRYETSIRLQSRIPTPRATIRSVSYVALCETQMNLYLIRETQRN